MAERVQFNGWPGAGHLTSGLFPFLDPCVIVKLTGVAKPIFPQTRQRFRFVCAQRHADQIAICRDEIRTRIAGPQHTQLPGRKALERKVRMLRVDEDGVGEERPAGPR